MGRSSIILKSAIPRLSTLPDAILVSCRKHFLRPKILLATSWCTVALFGTFLSGSIYPMTLQPKSGLGIHYLLPRQNSVVSGQLPIATMQKIWQHPVAPHLPMFSGLSNRSYSSKLSLKHFLRNPCAFHPLDMSRPLKPFQFDTCYKVKFTIQFTQFLVVSNLSLTVILTWAIDSPQYLPFENT
jgi:hypothetical protein